MILVYSNINIHSLFAGLKRVRQRPDNEGLGNCYSDNGGQVALLQKKQHLPSMKYPDKDYYDGKGLSTEKGLRVFEKKFSDDEKFFFRKKRKSGEKKGNHVSEVLGFTYS